MSKKLLEVKKAELEAHQATLIEQYLAVSKDLRTNLDAKATVKLKEQQADLENEIKNVEDELEDVTNKFGNQDNDYRKLSRDLKNKIPKIDYKKARRIAQGVLSRFEQEPGEQGGVLFLLQKSNEMGGEWCLAAIRELLDKGNGKLISHEIVFTSLERPPSEIELLGKLAGRLNAKLDENDLKQSADAVVEKLCASVQSGGAVFVQIEFTDSRALNTGLLRWFVEDFWCALVEGLMVLAPARKRFQFVVAIVVASAVPRECVDSYLGCLDQAFDFKKILELPLENWTTDDIDRWLVDHSGLKLHGERYTDLAEAIYSNSNSGIPRFAHALLLKHLIDDKPTARE